MENCKALPSDHLPIPVLQVAAQDVAGKYALLHD